MLAKIFEVLRETSEERDVSMKIGYGEKERVQSGDTLFNKLNFNDMGSQKRVKETHTNTSTQVPGTDHLVFETPPEDAYKIFKKMKETRRAAQAMGRVGGVRKERAES